jgi:hypothetical protein
MQEQGPQTPASRPIEPGGVVVALGGLIAVVSSLLAWVKIQADFTQFGSGIQQRSFSGLDSSDGQIVLGVGIALIVAGVLTWVVKGSGARLGLAVFSVIGGLIAGAIGLYDALTAESQVSDQVSQTLATSAGVSVAEARRVYQQLLDGGFLEVSVSIGLWLAVVGGAVAFAGGLVLLWSRRKAAAGTIASGTAAPPTLGV